ncbi:hypothetical protein H072_425 [Dactylellina haptotyla CBS 200.50]|uniref:Transcription elongation factor Eaf N-terminal domain-containing protein n=1 Tax=Dactylellina haptotyla (strain CBS 200.50) TaxID=1284197 RepID=S8AX90_DACHA|nr:hypothetical protein H072_425 [Dactylellina haptotyla CBS 200.50]
MAAATAVEFNPTRHGKFKVLVGDSLKHAGDEGQSSTIYSSFRYNTAPPTVTSKLSQADGNGQFELSYDDSKDTAYTGTQRPGRKLECILVYNPKDNSFTLERMSSIFTFNQSHPVSDLASIPTATYDDEQAAGGGGNSTDDEDTQLADAENPFDVRHFNSRILPNSDEDEDDREEQKEEDTDVDMEDVDAHNSSARSPEQERETALTPGPSSSTPIPASSAAATPNPSLPPLKRKPKKPVDPFMKKPSRPPKATVSSNIGKSPLLHPDAALNPREASMSPQPRLPSPMHLDRKPSGRKARIQEPSSESDADSSGADSGDDRRGRKPPINKHIRSSGMSREPSYTGSILSAHAPDELEFPDPKGEDKGEANDEEDFDLDAAMAEEFDFMNSDEEGGIGGSGGDLMIEGEDDNRIGLGINNIGSTVAPMSLSSMTGGRRKDESEEESSEEE